MGVEAAFPTDGEAAKLVQQRDGLFHDVAQLAQALDPAGLATRDDWLGAAFTARLAEGFAVVTLVGQQDIEAAAGPAVSAGDGWVASEQVDRG